MPFVNKIKKEVRGPLFLNSNKKAVVFSDMEMKASSVWSGPLFEFYGTLLKGFPVDRKILLSY